MDEYITPLGPKHELSEKKRKFKEQAIKLSDAYTEMLSVFHETSHFTAAKEIHEAIYFINCAIKHLEEAANDRY